MSTLQSLAKQWASVQEADAAARLKWDELHKETKKLVRMAGLGRKSKMVVPISESRGVRIVNQFRTREDKLFTPAFCKRYKVDEVPLGDD